MFKKAFVILFLLILIGNSCSAGIFKKKNYRDIFLQDAVKAVQRKNYADAFNLYEKALYYYPRDIKILKSYAYFCEKNGFFDKAAVLNKRLYSITKDKNYIFKERLAAIKTGKFTNGKLKYFISDKNLTNLQKKEITYALIFKFTFENDWNNTRDACNSLKMKDIDNQIITQCIVANIKKPKLSDSKLLYQYFIRDAELNPKDNVLIKKVIDLSEARTDYITEEKYLKKFSDLNQNNKGIQYKLAGFYIKINQPQKAVAVYKKLISKGDKSSYVKSSYEYALMLARGQKSPSSSSKKVIIPKTKQKILAQNDKNIKMSKQSYFIIAKPPSEEEKLKTALYKAMDKKDFSKALDISEDLVKKYPNNVDYEHFALQNAMASKNWDKALSYANILLEKNPNSEDLLKTIGDVYSIKQNYTTAIEYYTKLVNLYPKLEYVLTLVNLNMGAHNFSDAEKIIESIYDNNYNSYDISQIYLNTLLAQNKIDEAYDVIKKSKLTGTKEYYRVKGDLLAEKKKFKEAHIYYSEAVKLSPNDDSLKIKLASCYREMKSYKVAETIYNEILAKDKNNIDALMGLGYIELSKKNERKSKDIFSKVLVMKPDYNPAQMGMVYSNLANGDNIKAIDYMDTMPQNDDIKLLKANAYFDMNMPDNAKEEILHVNNDNAEVLKGKIKRDEAITFTPQYSFMLQQLSQEFRLNYQKAGATLSESIPGNGRIFETYNAIVYSSGGANNFNNVVNEFIGGVQARPNKDWAYRGTIGVKAFQFDSNAMLTTDSWIQRYFGDDFNIKLGFKRDNIEQSYLSAVGEYVDGVFTGRAADNKLYLDFTQRFPHDVYLFGKGCYGAIYGQNLITNMYYEGLLGLGKLFYNNPDNPWVNSFSTELVSYNSSYQYNLLKIYSTTGKLFGGYFSPGYFNATTLNLKIEGNIKKWHLKYGIKAFGGIQNAVTPDMTTPTWGVSPYISYDINDNVSVNAQYDHYTYADIQRDLFAVNLVIRGFRHAKR